MSNLCICGCGKKSNCGKWVRGHWNIDKHHTEETKKKISHANKNPSEERRQQMSESHKNKKHTEEHKRKISKSLRGRVRPERVRENISIGKTGIKFTEKHRENLSKSHQGKPGNMKGKHHTKETLQKISNKVKGRFKEISPNWKGGVSFLPYCPKFTKNKREEIRKLYNRRCFICNLDEINNFTKFGKVKKLSIHHINYDKEQGCNGKKWELIPLCGKCHAKTNGNREFWIRIIKEKLLNNCLIL